MNFSEFLRTVPAFADFDGREIAILEKAMVVQEYPDGHVFVHQGKGADALHLLVDGEVAVRRLRADQRAVDEFVRLRPGDVFGLVALIDHGPRLATCAAIGKVTVASLPRAAFGLLYGSAPHMAYHFQHMIARQLVHDLRFYTEALLSQISGDNVFQTYEAVMGKKPGYRGPERRTGDRRHEDRRKGYRPLVV